MRLSSALHVDHARFLLALPRRDTHFTNSACGAGRALLPHKIRPRYSIVTKGGSCALGGGLCSWHPATPRGVSAVLPFGHRQAGVKVFYFESVLPVRHWYYIHNSTFDYDD